MVIKKINNNELICLLEIEKKFFSNSQFYSMKQLKEMFQNKNYNFIGIYENKILIGYLIVMDIDQECEIIQIAIEKQHQKKNYGSFLIKYLQEKYLKITLEVNNKNKIAINFYLKNKFKQIAVRNKYYNNIDDALILKWSSN